MAARPTANRPRHRDHMDKLRSARFAPAIWGRDLVRDAQELLALVATFEQPPQRRRRVLQAMLHVDLVLGHRRRAAHKCDFSVRSEMGRASSFSGSRRSRWMGTTNEGEAAESGLTLNA